MQGGQEPQRSHGDGGSGRSVYLARRIVAVLVVLVLLALLVPRACQAFTESEEQPEPEASQVTEVSSAGGGEEETATTQEGASGNSEVVDAMTNVVQPVPTGGEEASRSESGGVLSIEVATSPAGVVAAPETPPGNIVGNTTNQPAQTPSAAPPSTAPPSTAPPSTAPPSTAPPSTAPPSTALVSNVFTGNQQQLVQPTAFGEIVAPSRSIAFGEGITFGGEAPFGDKASFGEGSFFEGTVFEGQGSSGVAVATGGSVVAVAGSSVAIA